MLIFEIKAHSLTEANEIAKQKGITVVKNVTSWWKNVGQPMSDRELRTFAASSLIRSRLAKVEGTGLVIEIVKGHKNRKLRPYTYVNRLFSGGRRRKQKYYEIRKKSNNELLATAKSKELAIKRSKNLIINQKEDLIGTVSYEVVKEDRLSFTLKYTPSVTTAEGKYLVFGTPKEKYILK